MAKIFTTAIFSLFTLWCSGQIRYIFESGAYIYNPSEERLIRIRGDKPNYLNYYSNSRRNNTDHLTALSLSYFAGIKIEKRFWSEKLGISAGLRYLHLANTLSKRTYSGSPSNYFYFLFNESGTTTEYLTIESMAEKSNYLTIPIELRLYPFEKRKIKMFFKLMTDIGYRVSYKNVIEFNDATMKVYENEVESIIGIPGSACNSVGVGAGFQFQKIFIVEGNISGFMSKNSSLFNSNIGAGVQLSVVIPAKSNLK